MKIALLCDTDHIIGAKDCPLVQWQVGSIDLG